MRSDIGPSLDLEDIRGEGMGSVTTGASPLTNPALAGKILRLGNLSRASRSYDWHVN